MPGLTDFTFMEEKKAKLFVNTPNALADNKAGKCDTADAKFQSEEAGLADFTGTEEEIFAGCLLYTSRVQILTAEPCEKAGFFHYLKKAWNRYRNLCYDKKNGSTETETVWEETENG